MDTPNICLTTCSKNRISSIVNVTHYISDSTHYLFLHHSVYLLILDVDIHLINRLKQSFEVLKTMHLLKCTYNVDHLEDGLYLFYVDEI